MGNGAPQNQKAVAVLWCRMLQFQRWTAYHEPIMISCFQTGHYFHRSHWVFLFQTIFNNHDHLLSCTTCGISPLNSSLLCRNENLSTAELRWGRQTSAIYIIQCAKLLSIPPTNPAETQWVWREWRINYYTCLNIQRSSKIPHSTFMTSYGFQSWQKPVEESAVPGCRDTEGEQTPNRASSIITSLLLQIKTKHYNCALE